MMEFFDIFNIFAKSGMPLDPLTNTFQGGLSEMARLQANLEEFKEEEEFFKSRFGDEL
jgi:hypothetical protein